MKNYTASYVSTLMKHYYKIKIFEESYYDLNYLI